MQRSVSWRALGGILFAGVGCQTPTSMTIEVSTNATCDGASDFTASLGRPGEVDPAAPTSTRACAGKDDAGTVVALPGGDENAEIAMQIALGVGVPTSDCIVDGTPGCIIARRQLRFLPGEAMVLEVPLSTACLGVVCDPEDTCSDGVCVSAVIDSSSCNGGRCRTEDLGGSGSATSVAASSSSTEATTGSSSGGGDGGAGGQGGAGGDGGAGGAGGAGGQGGAGGAGGAGGGPTCGTLETSRLALGPDFSCVVSGPADDEHVYCRGIGASPAEPGWEPATRLEDNDQLLTCVEHIEAGGDVLCARVHAGQGCPPQAGVYCTDMASAYPLQMTFVGSQFELMTVGAVDTCVLAPLGGPVVCTGNVQPASLDALTPLRGADGGGTGFCAWGEAGGPICWGNPALVGVPDFAGACITDLEVAEGYACAAAGAAVKCWGALPASVQDTTSLEAPVVDLAVGDAHVCALLSNDEVRCWGDGTSGQLGAGNLLLSVQPVEPVWTGRQASPTLGIAAGSRHTVFLAGSPGELTGWGDNSARQLGDDPANELRFPAFLPFVPPL